MLLSLAAHPQTPAPAPMPKTESPHARQAWEALQQRFTEAAAISFTASGTYLSTAPNHPGRSLALIEVSVNVANPGFGEVHVAARATGAPENASIAVSSFGTEEGIWSVAHGQDRAFGCGAQWNRSTELDDFAFLGPAWSGWCARRGAAHQVSFVPAHAEHPGLTGIRVRWNADGEEGQRSTIFWLDQTGAMHSADVRIDAETVLHWEFRDFRTQAECDPAGFVARLPEGFVREGFGVAEASANGAVGLTGAAPATSEPRAVTPIENTAEEAIERSCGGEPHPETGEPPAGDPPVGSDD